MSEATETSAPSGAGGLPQLLRQLNVVYCPGKPSQRVVTLAGGAWVLGRDAGGDQTLRLEDTEVSRQHAEVAPDAATGGWTIADRGSRNGLLVGGVKVERQALAPGSVIRVGRSLLVYSETLLDPLEPLVRETPNLLGNSLPMQRLRGQIKLVAERRTPVLVTGETGSGKECVARELHERTRRAGPFVPVNCAAIPKDLAESELFGHAAGAFTGAGGRSEGLFVAAEGGTLFLDEIGDLPAALQPTLLRAIALGEVRPVGRAEARRVDARVVAATHRDLEAAVAAGSFRADLYARLTAWVLRVPPLRERREDILWLARGFLEREAGRPELSPGAAEALLLHDWPLNVRELEHTVAAAAARVAGGPRLHAENLPDAIGGRVTARRLEDGASRLDVARNLVPSADDLRRVIDHFGGNISKVAGYFGKDRRQIYRWMERHGLGEP